MPLRYRFQLFLELGLFKDKLVKPVYYSKGFWFSVKRVVLKGALYGSVDSSVLVEKFLALKIYSLFISFLISLFVLGTERTCELNLSGQKLLF